MAGAIVRRSPYKDFLQPALHRRFSTTASILLGVAYLQAILLAGWNSWLWVWFPIGPTGIRALFLGACSIAIIILRIGYYHVGVRTSQSGFQTFYNYALTMATGWTILVYVASAFLFSQVYLWSLPETAQLEWFTYFQPGRPRLNEKAVFFTIHFVLLGLFQAATHLYEDVDRLSLGVARGQTGASSQANKFVDLLPAMLISTINKSFFAIMLSTIVYPLFLRAWVWYGLMTLLRPFITLPKTNMVPSAWPYSFGNIIRCWVASLMLIAVWNIANNAFSAFLVTKPLKNNKPLTSESKDPNGSLLNGLKSKKLSIRCFAMWELSYIAQDFEERRKAIYEDIDRKDGPMWSQVYAICLDLLKDMEMRVDFYGKAPPPVAPPPEPVQPKRRTTQPPKEDEDIFQTLPQKKTFRAEVEKAVTHVTVSPGQGSQLSPLAKKTVASAKIGLLNAQKGVTGTSDPQTLFTTVALKVVSSAVGWPFRHEYRRQLTSVVLGEPYGEPSLYINAITALGLLAVNSLNEDKYGNVQRDVAAIIRTLTTITKKLQDFTNDLPTHWTDVEAKRQCPEVEIILEALRTALTELVTAFGPFARDLRLSLADMRLAREAATPPPPNP
ncbi:nucleoporin protein Ndc1-Nup [Podospora didyma]|uniref:Nucleoporin protein Ndc1-Nup n=1 Tax=Podospora didyma TaxID=330526 RepID=A0AAE0NU12_9PEZI|nr:nucleoporin protein Ndc1-Nup [Podospora didyma]